MRRVSERFLFSAEAVNERGETVDSFDLSEPARDSLVAEAERRGISPSALSVLILETVVRDNLFSAVLDE
ncbi:MAG: hypothetical protein KIS96_11470 [Bauldia sp.]|nr:hypothetical protein [Bauldia sp.]